MNTLNRSFFQREPKIVAKDLLGKLIVRKIGEELLVGKIVETEAYLAEGDGAAHASKGKTKANASLFLDGGHAYVHKIHAYHCLDTVCQVENIGGSVLIRALEPIKGIQKMKKLRGKDNLRDLTTGPGKICLSFAIDKQLDGIDLTSDLSPLRVCSAEPGDKLEIDTSTRIGISKDAHYELRFTISDNAFLSR
jgi:DNA-3-methyladenine glycosylase